MSDGNTSRAALVDYALKECVPERASGLLDVPAMAFCGCCDVLAVKDEVEAERASQRGNKFGVAIGFGAAQLMVEMHDRQRDAQFHVDPLKDPKERNGIRAAGYGHANTIPGREHPRVANVLQDGLFQRSSHGLLHLSLDVRAESYSSSQIGRGRATQAVASGGATDYRRSATCCVNRSRL